MIVFLFCFFNFGVEFFLTPKRKRTSRTTKINYCVLSMCTCAKLKIFLFTEKCQEWTQALRKPLLYKILSFFLAHIWISFRTVTIIEQQEKVRSHPYSTLPLPGLTNFRIFTFHVKPKMFTPHFYLHFCTHSGSSQEPSTLLRLFDSITCSQTPSGGYICG